MHVLFAHVQTTPLVRAYYHHQNQFRCQNVWVREDKGRLDGYVHVPKITITTHAE